MEQHKPNVSEDLAKKLVKDLYGLEVSAIKRMISFDDQNFHILVSANHQNPNINNLSDSGYTLKIINTKKSETPEYFDSMHGIMFHQHSKGIRTPLPVKNLHGNTYSLESVPLLNEDTNDDETATTKRCGVHLLTYIPGKPISAIECTPNIFYQWGILLANYHNAVKDFDCPSLKTKTLLWSLESIPKLENYMNVLPEDKKEIIRNILVRYSTEIVPQLHKLQKGVIHGDFNENNVLVQQFVTESGKVTQSVDGVLDFEDIHVGAYIWDVGVMLTYCLIVYNGEDLLDAPGYALAGYMSKRSLKSIELALLKSCIECRLCQSLVLNAYNYQKDPSNDYLLITAKTGWTKLQTLCSLTAEDLLYKWDNLEMPSE